MQKNNFKCAVNTLCRSFFKRLLDSSSCSNPSWCLVVIDLLHIVYPCFRLCRRFNLLDRVLGSIRFNAYDPPVTGYHIGQALVFGFFRRRAKCKPCYAFDLMHLKRPHI